MSGWDEDEEVPYEALKALKAVERDGKKGRGPVDLIWRAIADDDLSDEDTARWARSIAQQVVKNVIDDKSGSPGERARRALQALRLYGPEDEPYRERQVLEFILAVEGLSHIEGGGLFERPPNFGPVKFTRSELLGRMRDQGCYDGVRDKDALKRIDRLLEHLPRKS